MKRLILIIACAVLSIPLFTQELAHETLVVNIEVQVRVFKGSKFINNLAKDDIDEKKLLKFADYLKENEGQKYVFLFYQKEVLPELDTKTKLRIISMSQDKPNEIAMIYDLFEFFHRDITFDVNRVKQAFADSLISIHFLFITRTHMKRLPITSMRPSEELRYVEKSEDIFSAFRKMAKATGGLTDSSANAASSFKRAVDASENYYLLYYSPLNYVRDGKFRSIKVKIRDKNYRIAHRAGYFAN